ncbi:MAG: Fur family transcriptional regulator [Bosea sp. (in: a-proteobacteria)]
MAQARHNHDHAGHDHGAHDHSGQHPGCQHARDRKADAAEIMARAEASCAKAGSRLTPIRRAVLAELVADHRPLGAYDLVERVSQREGRRLSPISVYRALDFLVENEMAHRLTSRNAFIACPHHHDAATLVVFLICEACGGVDEIMTPSVASALDEAAAQADFSAQRRTIEINGRCGHCKGAKGVEKTA